MKILGKLLLVGILQRWLISKGNGSKGIRMNYVKMLQIETDQPRDIFLAVTRGMRMKRAIDGDT